MARADLEVTIKSPVDYARAIESMLAKLDETERIAFNFLIHGARAEVDARIMEEVLAWRALDNSEREEAPIVESMKPMRGRAPSARRTRGGDER